MCSNIFDFEDYFPGGEVPAWNSLFWDEEPEVEVDPWLEEEEEEEEEDE